MKYGQQLFFEDVEIGCDIGTVEHVFRSEQVQSFVDIWLVERGPSRFTDDEMAKKEGLPRAIVPGAMNIAMISKLITDWTPSVKLRTLDVVFRGIVFQDTLVKVQGVVTGATMENGDACLDCDVYMEDEEGVRLVIGQATVALPTRDAG